MRGCLKVAAVAALITAAMAVTTASADKAEVVRVGDLEMAFNGGFTPKALSKTKLTPIKFTAEANIKTTDGSHPPALQEFIVDTDKNGAINVAGIPVCKAGQLQAQDTRHAEEACRSAIIGTGQGTAEIAFPESSPILAKSKIIAFNGGVKGGVTTLYVHAYITVPTPAAIVSTVKVKKIHKGRYGLEAVTTIPKIAGGSGSVTHFDLTFTKHGVLSAKCTDGKLQAHATAIFSDGTQASASIIRACIPK